MSQSIKWRIRKLEETPSTNDDAKKAAIAGEEAGLVFWGLCQTAGRGRHGRVWLSEPGNLYCSLLLRPTIARAEIGLFSFVAALAIHGMLRTFLSRAPIALKWPNDVLVAGKKISGILLEVEGDALIVGMGFNAAHHPEQGLYPTTSLAAEAPELKVGLDLILDRLLTQFEQWQDRLQNEGFAPVRKAWLDACARGSLTVKAPNGEIFVGEFVDLDLNGNLRLRLADGQERAIATGDVFMLPRG